MPRKARSRRATPKRILTGFEALNPANVKSFDACPRPFNYGSAGQVPQSQSPPSPNPIDHAEIHKALDRRYTELFSAFQAAATACANFEHTNVSDPKFIDVASVLRTCSENLIAAHAQFLNFCRSL